MRTRLHFLAVAHVSVLLVLLRLLLRVVLRMHLLVHHVQRMRTILPLLVLRMAIRMGHASPLSQMERLPLVDAAPLSSKCLVPVGSIHCGPRTTRMLHLLLVDRMVLWLGWK